MIILLFNLMITTFQKEFQIPDAKLIVMLRNPVSRAYSFYNYFMDKKIGGKFETILPYDNNKQVESIIKGGKSSDEKKEYFKYCNVSFESRIAEEYNLLSYCKYFNENWNPLPVCLIHSNYSYFILISFY